MAQRAMTHIMMYYRLQDGNEVRGSVPLRRFRLPFGSYEVPVPGSDVSFYIVPRGRVDINRAGSVHLVKITGSSVYAVNADNCGHYLGVIYDNVRTYQELREVMDVPDLLTSEFIRQRLEQRLSVKKVYLLTTQDFIASVQALHLVKTTGDKNMGRPKKNPDPVMDDENGEVQEAPKKRERKAKSDEAAAEQSVFETAGQEVDQHLTAIKESIAALPAVLKLVFKEAGRLTKAAEKVTDAPEVDVKALEKSCLLARKDAEKAEAALAKAAEKEGARLEKAQSQAFKAERKATLDAIKAEIAAVKASEEEFKDDKKWQKYTVALLKNLHDEIKDAPFPGDE